MSNRTFIGIGRNPGGPDLPIGLGMKLAQNPEALKAFGRMSNEQKAAMIEHIKGASSGEDARSRIENAVERLGRGEN